MQELECNVTDLQRQRRIGSVRDMNIPAIDVQENMFDDVGNDRFSRNRRHDASSARPGLTRSALPGAGGSVAGFSGSSKPQWPGLTGQQDAFRFRDGGGDRVGEPGACLYQAIHDSEVGGQAQAGSGRYRHIRTGKQVAE